LRPKVVKIYVGAFFKNFAYLFIPGEPDTLNTDPDYRVLNSLSVEVL
jgi:hypothetical protein